MIRQKVRGLKCVSDHTWYDKISLDSTPSHDPVTVHPTGVISDDCSDDIEVSEHQHQVGRNILKDVEHFVVSVSEKES